MKQLIMENRNDSFDRSQPPHAEEATKKLMPRFDGPGEHLLRLLISLSSLITQRLLGFHTN